MESAVRRWRGSKKTDRSSLTIMILVEAGLEGGEGAKRYGWGGAVLERDVG